ncbi:TetR/AcrR family transcriptional regulator [Paenibacillus sp. VMFN-D1]|uniref:TetR/AcrR family transcriptional regulator n=1 Tax=Paenibacillus sp. VMFN-D1 TaxID=2135608 RepID=UPI000E26D3F7|nr:TetR/AcrR family transcriptional regulator [Paenibacillus sp. VMFN-D1]RED37399.1 TetR family transcriptional regulator [Paenibacillus sp. VMFN-D1]
MPQNQDSKQNIIRTNMIKKLIPTIMKEGFQDMRMENVANYMDVSRAKLYKYFSSKESVLVGIVEVYVDYINELVLETSDDTETSYATRFQNLFEQSIQLAVNISDLFLKELQATYPDLYNQLKDAMFQREQETVKFYEEGIKNGIFNEINVRFIILQDDVLLREIIDAKYLIRNQVSIQQVLFDYYTLKKIQLFKSDKIGGIDDSKIKPVIEHIARKINASF